MKTENATYVAIKEDGKRKVYPEDDVLAMVKAAEEKGEDGPTSLASQTFPILEVESDAEFLELVPTEGERVNLYNRAVVLKQQQGIRRLLGAENFVPVEGLYDLRELIAKPTERRAASPRDKAIRALEGLDAATLKDVLAQFLAAAA